MKDVNIILAELPGMGRVRLCECNSVHLNIGPVTINLEPMAFAQVAVLIDLAMNELDKIVEAKAAEEEIALPLQSHLMHGRLIGPYYFN